MASPDGSSGVSPESEGTRFDREKLYRRRRAWALLLSLVLHGGFVLLALLVRISPPSPPGLVHPERPPPEGALKLVEIRPPQAATPPARAPEARQAQPPPPAKRPEEEMEVVPIVPVPAAPEEEVGAGEEERPEVAGEEELTNAERLRQRIGDRRLWVDFRDRAIYGEQLERYARADSALRSILRDWLDSLALTADQRRRALDWTFGKGGKRWGISPEGLHLGDITIPIPFGQFFSLSGPKAREAQQALRDLYEIQQQDLRADLDKNREERIKEMRRRSKEEAERRKSQDSTSSGN